MLYAIFFLAAFSSFELSSFSFVCDQHVEYSFLIIHGQVEPGAADAAAVAPSMCTGDCNGGAAHPATCHCVDCGEDYCEQLAAAHRKFRMSRDHTLVTLAEKGRAVSTLCSTHLDEKFK